MDSKFQKTQKNLIDCTMMLKLALSIEHIFWLQEDHLLIQNLAYTDNTYWIIISQILRLGKFSNLNQNRETTYGIRIHQIFLGLLGLRIVYMFTLIALESVRFFWLFGLRKYSHEILHKDHLFDQNPSVFLDFWDLENTGCEVSSRRFFLLCVRN